MKHLSQAWIKAMSEVDRIVLSKIIRDEHKTNGPRSSIDDYFEVFSAEQILKSCGVDIDVGRIDSGVVGGGGDGGVNSIYLFGNNLLIMEDTDLALFGNQQISVDLYIVQSKHRNSYTEAAIQKLEDFVEKCLRLDADTKKVSSKLFNKEVIRKAEKFKELIDQVASKRPTVKIRFFYAALAEVLDEKVKLRANCLIEKCQSIFSFAETSFDFLGSSELLKWYFKKPDKDITLHTEDNLPISSEFGTAYLCVVPLSNFFNFIVDDRKQLRSQIFEANVRDYLGRAHVNKEISETLNGDGKEQFWWLNNGVTIICSKIWSTGKPVHITDPLVVNGLQTSHIVYKHFSDPAKRDKRSILIRVIQCTDASSIDRIIKATNSQTEIKPIHLHSTEPIHRKIEVSLKDYGFYYDRRKNFYRNQGRSVPEIVTIQQMAQAVVAVLLQRPADARARPSTVADRIYNSIFSDKHPIDLYGKCICIARKVDVYLGGVEPSKRTITDIKFYLATFVSCLVLKTAKPTPQLISNMELGAITNDVLEEGYKTVLPLYEKCGGNDEAAKGTALTEKLMKEIARRFIDPHRPIRIPAKAKQ